MATARTKRRASGRVADGDTRCLQVCGEISDRAVVMRASKVRGESVLPTPAVMTQPARRTGETI